MFFALSLPSSFPMDSYSSSQTSKFVDLLNSQQTISFGNYEDTASQASVANLGTDAGGETGTERRERMQWTPADDIMLISAWLNTSKDPVVSNEQKSSTFWTRVATFFAASQKVSGCEPRVGNNCKQRWHKINDLVCKFCGAYEDATRQRRSGQNDNDVLKLAHEIFFNNHRKKFNLEYAWNELKNDQKWCEVASAKNIGRSKKRKGEDAGDSSSSQATETMRPPGVKAAKSRGKKTADEENAMKKFETMWNIKQQDMAMKERLSKMTLLDSLVAKKEPLSDYEEALKQKLTKELLFN